MKIMPVSFNNYFCNNKPDNQTFCAIKPIPVERYNELRVFLHHIYEYKKGLRNLILTTEKIYNREYITERLEKERIPYIIRPAREKTINVFFGNEDCIQTISTFDEHLSKLSPEKDFMLGIMLGYDKVLQCKRYLKRLGKSPAPFQG